MNKNVCILIAGILSISSATFAQEKKDPVILNIAGENISKSEFERVFRKNNTKESSFDKKSVNDYLNLYINYKLKVKEAMELGMDTAKSFTDELMGYRKQLAQPYLVDKEVTDNLLKEAYGRLKTDIRASHILVKLSPDALPKDTLEAYNKATKIRQEILKGADFASVARQKSDDPSAKENGGDLGYFTAMQMVYPFESAAYNTKAGEISMPVRTRFGYHLIKVAETRPAQGEVKVAHIMVKAANGIKAEDSLAAVQKINEIYGKLKAGENFDELAKKFSDDQGSAKNGGVLPVFGTGRMVPEFEKVAFEIKNVNDYSNPIKTSYGWHIIKLLEKKPLGTYEELQSDLKSKVGKDSRSELSKSSMINRIKQKYNFKEMPKAKDEFMKIVDSSLVQGKWTADQAANLKNVLFTLSNASFSQQDFSKYLEDHQSHKTSSSPQALANNSYSEWVNESCIAFEEKHLDSLYPDFRNLMQEYRDGILLFELTDKKVWSKAVKDTAGLKEFYEKNKNNYKWNDRVDATIYMCANADVAKDVRKQMKKIDDVDTLLSRINKSSQLNLQVKSAKYSKGDNEIIDSIQWVAGITKDMKKNNQVIFVDVKKVLPSQPKTIEEAKGLVTADYQGYLEKEWIGSLRQKYPVKTYQEVVDTVTR
ncbi:MAG: peptidylprolyl isomerase [Bacteroidetes bacterium]|nr:peptidylprolyl isomerase [Bacteroidota bacterium]